MRKIHCYECGKQYDYDEDGFCPKCGSFNQPPRSSVIGADGSVVRTDGLNERNHKNSFVHKELHAENRERKAIGLSKGVRRTASGAAHRSQSRTQGRGLGSVIFWIILAIFALNVFSNLFYLF